VAAVCAGKWSRPEALVRRASGSGRPSVSVSGAGGCACQGLEYGGRPSRHAGVRQPICGARGYAVAEVAKIAVVER